MNLQISFRNTVEPLNSILSNSFDKSSLTPYEMIVVKIIQGWHTTAPELVLSTSGSTGLTKEVIINKEEAVLSAKRTIEYFSLKQGDAALLCIDCRFVGGFMMIVRSIVAGMNMIVMEPTANPLTSLKPDQYPSFIALVPLQLASSLKILNKKDHKTSNLKGIIVGGAPIDSAILKAVRAIDEPIYQTFGMTETISHIALRKISGKDHSDVYTLLPGIMIKSDKEKRLLINLGEGEWINTNDIVEILEKGNFKWLGRIDNVINSGGVKINPEVIESEIGTVLKEIGFEGRHFAAGMSDPKLSEKVVLVVEGEISDDAKESLLLILKKRLPRYYSPKEVICFEKFIETENGKIKRQDTLKYYLNR